MFRFHRNYLRAVCPAFPQAWGIRDRDTRLRPCEKASLRPNKANRPEVSLSFASLLRRSTEMTQMNKLMILAATSMLALGLGQAFAHTPDATAQANRSMEARTAAQPPANRSHLLFPASGHHHVDAYSLFPDGSGGLRGN